MPDTQEREIPIFTRVIVESPAGNIERNQRYLRACMRDCIEREETPYASHGLLTQPGVLRDHDPWERKLGIFAGFEWRTVAEKTVFYLDLGMSEGMKLAEEHCRLLGDWHLVEYRQLGGEWSE